LALSKSAVAHGVDGGVTRIFSRCSCLFSSPSSCFRRLTRFLSLLPDLIECFTMLLMNSSCFFGESPGLFSLAPSSFIHYTAFLREAAVVFSIPILAFGLVACPFRFEPLLLAPKIVICHWILLCCHLRRRTSTSLHVFIPCRFFRHFTTLMRTSEKHRIPILLVVQSFSSPARKAFHNRNK
jgi:hypothetical protein